MSLKYLLRDLLLDISKMGPRFCFQGIKSYKRSSSLQAIDVPGVGRLTIRPRDSDFETIRQVFRNEDYKLTTKNAEERVRSRYEEIASSGKTPVIIDAGANIGAAALWFAKKYPQAIVVAIEPDPANADILRKNASGTNIRVIEAAIGSEDGFVALQKQGDSWGVTTTRAQSGLRIVTVEAALNGISNGELFIVKVDIEGFESDLFASNTDWIDQAFVLYVEPHDWLFPGKRTSRSFQREVSKRDFELFIRGENLVYVR